MRSYFQSRAILRTPDTIARGVIARPEGNRRASLSADARNLIFVPPMSTVSTFTDGALRWRVSRGRSARLLELRALGGDHAHELVPRLHERLRAIALELRGHCVEIDACLAELREHLLAVAAVS